MAITGRGFGFQPAAGAWGILRNMMQEFAALKWSGVDHDARSATVTAMTPASDVFGMASQGVFVYYVS